MNTPDHDRPNDDSDFETDARSEARKELKAAWRALDDAHDALELTDAQREHLDACVKRFMTAAAECGAAASLGGLEEYGAELQAASRQQCGAYLSKLALEPDMATEEAVLAASSPRAIVVPFPKALDDEEQKDWIATYDRFLNHEHRLECTTHDDALRGLRIEARDAKSALVIEPCCSRVAKDVRGATRILAALASAADRAPTRIPAHAAPSKWIDHMGVLILLPQSARALWRGGEELPEAERRRFDDSPTHFRFAHDHVRDDGVRTVALDGTDALLFGYGPTHTCWIPFEDFRGGTLVRLSAGFYGDHDDQPAFDVAVSAATKTATREPTPGRYVARGESHDLFPAIVSGAAVGESLARERLAIRLVPDTYEVWSKRLLHQLTGWELIVYRFVPR